MREKGNNQESFINNITKNKVNFIISIAIVLLILILVILILLINRKTPEYTITFDTNGGSIIESIIVKENSTIERPENPTKENYEFVGWYYNNELYNFNTPVICDMTLEARWAELGTGKVAAIKLDVIELDLYIGDTYKLLATVLPEDANNKSVTWESSAPDIVSVDAEGNILALKEGTATITVTTVEGGYTANVTVTVTIAEESVTVNNGTTADRPSDNKPNNNNNNNNNNDEPTNTPTVIKVTGVALNTTSISLTEGQTSKLTATVNPSNAENKNVTWKSSNATIVSVDANGNIKALKAGNATITVTTADGGYTATATITVNKATVNVTGVTLNKTSLSLTEGDTSKLTATVNPSNATNKNVTWSSSNSNVVSVDANGNIKAIKAGTATITVTTKDGNYKATCQVTVKEKAPTYSVIFTPIIQEGTGAIVQYSVAATRNNSSFNDFNFIIYNGTKAVTTLASRKYDKSKTTATIRLNDGTDVTATVVYK